MKHIIVLNLLATTKKNSVLKAKRYLLKQSHQFRTKLDA
uniref:Uncharacterized protein n=1 Tax=Rhizophora mucronata TaxID=61149 RepID=A0A2P2NR21_RHIMU